MADFNPYPEYDPRNREVLQTTPDALSAQLEIRRRDDRVVPLAGTLLVGETLHQDARIAAQPLPIIIPGIGLRKPA